MFAGVPCVPVYTRLERGNTRGATNRYTTPVSRALLLDDAERAHLFNLVRAANATAAAAHAVPRRPARQPVRQDLSDLIGELRHPR